MYLELIKTVHIFIILLFLSYVYIYDIIIKSSLLNTCVQSSLESHSVTECHKQNLSNETTFPETSLLISLM